MLSVAKDADLMTSIRFVYVPHSWYKNGIIYSLKRGFTGGMLNEIYIYIYIYIHTHTHTRTHRHTDTHTHTEEYGYV